MISISLATLAMQFAGEAKQNTAKMKARKVRDRSFITSQGGGAVVLIGGFVF